MMLVNNLAAVAAAPSGGSDGGMSTILQFLLILTIIIFAAKAAGYISTRLGQPAVLGELLAGVFLGPSVLNLMNAGFVSDPEAMLATVRKLAELGVVLLMFMAGLEVNLGDMLKVGKVAAFGGISGVVVPVLMGGGLALAFNYSWEKALFIGIILAATSVSISAQTLLELGKLRTKEGIGLLGAAVLDDVLVVLVLSLFLALATSGGGGITDVLLVIVKMVLFFVVTSFLGVKVLPWLLNQVRKLPISEGLTAFTIVVVMLTAWSAEFLGGVAMIVGAFLAGALIGRTQVKHELEEKFHVIIYSFFVPIFFASIGLILNLWEIEGNAWFFAIGVSIVAIISKIVGCGIGARLGGFNNGESFRLGLGMVSRGEVGLIVASVGVTAGIITNQVYAAAVVMVLITTLFTPFALKLAFRNVKEEAEAEVDENTNRPSTSESGELAATRQ
jgi:Kef-type K+ transport system membrane component KefB